MPSDPLKEIALRALMDPIEHYRSAVVATAEEVRGFLAARQPKAEMGDGGVAAGLGQFASGRIDIHKFANLMTEAPAEDPNTLSRVEKAFDVLRVISSGGEEIFYVKVKSGGRLRDTVGERLADIGRAFAAARVAAMARLGNLNSGRNDVEPLGFERWSDAERRLAPPLAVEVDGADLYATDLAEFLDGSIKIVLIVTGETAPAPLVRLITPSTFVLQTVDETGMDRFAAADGPAVAALMPEGAARFIHDPAAGSSPAVRIEIYQLPEQAPKRPVGGKSGRQQADELEQLRMLAGAAAAEPVTETGGAGAGTSADKLAAWLLSQADMSNIE
jgi:hypothetical protein